MRHREAIFRRAENFVMIGFKMFCDQPRRISLVVLLLAEDHRKGRRRLSPAEHGGYGAGVYAAGKKKSDRNIAHRLHADALVYGVGDVLLNVRGGEKGCGRRRAPVTLG